MYLIFKWFWCLVFFPVVFKYTSGLHSVVELGSESAYKSCDISSSVDSLNGGNNVVKLNKAGTRYFACGTLGHCGQGMKVKITTVAADGSDSSTPSSSSSSSPTSTSTAPALSRSFALVVSTSLIFTLLFLVLFWIMRIRDYWRGIDCPLFGYLRKGVEVLFVSWEAN